MHTADIPECLCGGASAFPKVHHAGGAARCRGRFAVADMHAHHCAGSKGTAHITLWFGQNDVDLKAENVCSMIMIKSRHFFLHILLMFLWHATNHEFLNPLIPELWLQS